MRNDVENPQPRPPLRPVHPEAFGSEPVSPVPGGARWGGRGSPRSYAGPGCTTAVPGYPQPPAAPAPHAPGRAAAGTGGRRRGRPAGGAVPPGGGVGRGRPRYRPRAPHRGRRGCGNGSASAQRSEQRGCGNALKKEGEKRAFLRSAPLPSAAGRGPSLLGPRASPAMKWQRNRPRAAGPSGCRALGLA